MKKQPSKRQANKMTDEQINARVNLELFRGALLRIGKMNDSVGLLRKFKHKFNPDQIAGRYQFIQDDFNNLIENYREHGYGEIIDNAIKETGGLEKL